MRLAVPVSLSVGLALVIGKPAGIFVFAVVCVKSGLARLPEGTTWPMIVGGGCLAGIGFTMALFIADLALEGQLLETAKLGILCGSVVSAVAGVVILRAAGQTTPVVGNSE